jgi:hypothetical protein
MPLGTRSSVIRSGYGSVRATTRRSRGSSRGGADQRYEAGGRRHSRPFVPAFRPFGMNVIARACDNPLEAWEESEGARRALQARCTGVARDTCRLAISGRRPCSARSPSKSRKSLNARPRSSSMGRLRASRHRSAWKSKDRSKSEYTMQACTRCSLPLDEGVVKPSEGPNGESG